LDTVPIGRRSLKTLLEVFQNYFLSSIPYVSKPLKGGCGRIINNYQMGRSVNVISDKLAGLSLIFPNPAAFVSPSPSQPFLPLQLKSQYLCRWFRFAQLAKGKNFRP
jgi:hypothetical protein